ncbi:MAG: hypothetical protein HS111_35930 [Kofleriaceae bacterium]|nr:hypothetical protein [Kofleriaceae bacterium]
MGGGPVGRAGDHDVVGLEVAVDDATGVGGVERGRDLAQDRQGHRRRQGAVADPDPQRLAGQEVHDQVEATVGQPAEREDVDHRGVIDLVDGAGLAQEALGAVGPRRQLALEHLDRDLLADHRVVAGVDVAHRSAADPVIDDVLAGGLAGREVVAAAGGGGRGRAPRPRGDRRGPWDPGRCPAGAHAPMVRRRPAARTPVVWWRP